MAEAFEFVDNRAPGEILVRLTDPPLTIGGWVPVGTVLEVTCDDRQFIVTSVVEELHHLGRRVTRMADPVYGAERDDLGHLHDVSPARGARQRESLLVVELADRIPPAERAGLAAAVVAVLGDVFAATTDHASMLAELHRAAAALRAYGPTRYGGEEAEEAAALLDWLAEGNFVLAGTCRLPSDPSSGSVSSFGVLSQAGTPLLAGPVPPDPDVVLSVARTPEISRVHRQVPMHRVDVAEVGPDGSRSGTLRIVGVFSNRSAAVPAGVTPVLRAKLQRALALEDVVEGSHAEELLVSLFQGLPKEDLFEADVADLRATLVGLLAAEQQGQVRVLIRVQPESTTVSALLSVPQERYSSHLRRRVERFLMAQLDGTHVDAHVSIGDQADALLRLLVHVAELPPERSLDALEREVRVLCRTWDEELADALGQGSGPAAGAALAARWGPWFPPPYRETVAPADAASDLVALDQLMGAGGEEDLHIWLVGGDDELADGRARLRVLSRSGPVELSAFLPIVESLGLWVADERSHALGPDGPEAHLHDFGVVEPSGATLDPAGSGERLAAAAKALSAGRAEVDGLNRLVLRAGLDWDQVEVIRAYRRYRAVAGSTFTPGYMDDVLVEHAAATRALWDLFAARFDPGPDAGAEEIARRRAAVEARCDGVARLDHDRILRGIWALVDATLRTNHFWRRGDHVALKLDSSAVPDLPRPVPYREIFVHGPDTEGVHLRWGPVARGGIRWSERADDYRSEVLDLLQAQVLKNAVIVPTGAKGGFLVKRPGGSPAVRAAYETFIDGLLDLTDNIVAGADGADRVVAVPRRADGDDPYLVVAADRGTAALSDVANGLAEARGFWLGDAFASGGWRGYNHKALGVTARGTWVSVRHHLGELGIDPAADEVTVVGIGDLSGDVFGNGMLQSADIRLVAAFDHRDVFVDPDPDPAASYAERARVAALSPSSWQDYDRGAISPGGGVWSRLSKSIPVSPQARRALGIDPGMASISPPELIRSILQAPVTLLFAGGIGTFVRASGEPDRDLDDRANAEVRVAGAAIRARVVAEGANLAFTQRARVEYARRGGHLNTDAIDNSAGVDTSDREVNLKILLRLAMEAGEIGLDERDRMLSSVRDDVVASVLGATALQNAALSRALAASPADLDALEALMSGLESSGFLDRGVEALPSREEMSARAAAGAGLTRPELAVLLAAAKRSLAAAVATSALPEQAALRPVLSSYFPAVLARRFDHHLDHHRLRRELVASVVANDIVDRMGPTFVTRLAGDAGADPPKVVAAYLVSREVSGAAALWAGIDSGWSPHGADRLLVHLLDALTRDYLRRSGGLDGGLDGALDGRLDIAAVVGRDRLAFVELESSMADLGSSQQRRARARRASGLVDAGAEASSAVCWACLEELEIAPDAAALSRLTGRSVTDAADVFLRMSEALGLDRITARLRSTPASPRWERAARLGLAADVDDLRRLAAHRGLRACPDLPAADVVPTFLEGHRSLVDDARGVLREAEQDPGAGLHALAVAARAVRQAIGGW